MNLQEFIDFYNENEGHYGLDEAVFACVDPGSWEADLKYQFKDTVYQHVESGKYFMISVSRSGSYYSDYEYDEPTFSEVEPVEIKRIEYRVVPQE